MVNNAASRSRTASTIKAAEISSLFSKQGKLLHDKVDATRDAYFGFIFPINRSDLKAVTSIFDMDGETERTLFREARRFSSFKPGGRNGEVTNHIFGAAILAGRGKSLDTGLNAVTDESLGRLVEQHEQTVLDVAEARASWFGRIYFPAQAFANAIEVFGGKVSADAVYALAKRHGFAAEAGKRQTVRGNFGIAVWLTLLAFAP
jgi:hypothetical protein